MSEVPVYWSSDMIVRCHVAIWRLFEFPNWIAILLMGKDVAKILLDVLFSDVLSASNLMVKSDGLQNSSRGAQRGTSLKMNYLKMTCPNISVIMKGCSAQAVSDPEASTTCQLNWLQLPHQNGFTWARSAPLESHWAQRYCSHFSFLFWTWALRVGGFSWHTDYHIIWHTWWKENIYQPIKKIRR